MGATGHLFVTGSPWGRAFDIGMLLNEHPQVMLGVERFAAVTDTVDRFLLAPERLVAPLSVETKVRGELLYARLGERLKAGPPAITGDIDPAYLHAVPRIGMRLGAPQVVVVLGDPPPQVLPGWRSTVQLAQQTERQLFAGRVFVLPFERFAAGERIWLEALLSFLGLPQTARVEALYDRLCAGAAGRARSAASASASEGESELNAWLEARAQDELLAHEARTARPERIEDALLSPDELAARTVERQQLLEQRRSGSQWPDEDELLRARYREQLRETFGRGGGILRAGLTAAAGLPAPDLRVDVISPPAGPPGSARIDAFEWLVLHLGRLCRVRLLSAVPPRHRMPHVAVGLTNTFTPAHVGESDVVIYPADLPDTAVLAGTRRAVMLIDGFELAGDEHLARNLPDAREVLAASSWLCELARESGASPLLFPIGLERALFSPGPPNAERALHVTGMTAAADRGQWELLGEAMVHVREARPEVEVTLFGGVPADGATKFLLHPPLSRVAEALRSSAVHVTTSTHEGFNYIGAAALACGAALVTVDSAASRDFAIHDRTAVVAAPGDSRALAEAVLGLLDDSGRRASLASAGGRHVRMLLRPWSEVARALALILAEPATGP